MLSAGSRVGTGFAWGQMMSIRYPTGIEAMKSASIPRLVVVVNDRDRAATIRTGLDRAGYPLFSQLVDLGGLARRVIDEDADLVLIDLQRPTPAVLQNALQLVRVLDRPVVVFVDESTTADTRAAMEAGVSAYIINDLRAERIKPIVDMAISRFEAQKQLRDKLASTEQALRDRKIIDRAKGLLMSRKGLTEDEAYRLLRRTAMNTERRLVDIAHNIVNAANLLD